MDLFSLEGTDFNNSTQRLGEPYNGRMKLVSVEPVVDGDQEYVRFLFTVLDSPYAGSQYEHRFWTPRGNPGEEKYSKDAKRSHIMMAHIAYYFTDAPEGAEDVKAARETIVIKALVGKTWDELVAAVVDYFEKANLDRIVYGKINASVYNGRAQFPRFPNYLPFMADESSSGQLAFSSRELKQIEEWKAAREAAANAPTEDDLESFDGDTEVEGVEELLEA